MNASMILSFERNINDPLITFCPATLLARGDQNANVIKLTVMDGNAPADLSGNTAVVLFQRPGDSYVVRCPGSVSGNVISVTLLGDCYLYAGQYYASLILNADGFTRTMLRLAGHIESNGDGPVIDPTGTIPGYEDIARIYAELEASLGRSDAATDSANAAAQNANEKAALANEAAGNANAAADSADEATIRANEASESIEDLTVEASDVSYDQPATVTVTDVDGHKRIAFGLRQGVPGPVPTLTFTVKTGNPGTEVVVEQSGTPDAPVVGLTIPRGAPGEGAVSTVDGLMPVSGGNVELSAVRYVAQTLQTAQQLQARLNIGIIADTYSGAGVHNAIYQGANLGSTVSSDQWAAIQAGTFTDLYIGDYWTINGVNWRVAAFDYYLNTGDTACTDHHVVIVPDTILYRFAPNSTNTTDGGYVGSQMYTSGLTQAKNTINAAFDSSRILTHRQYLCNAVSNGKPSGGAWYDSAVELMTEQNCYGGKVFAEGNDGSSIPTLYTVDKSQYPLFAFRPDLISNRQTFCLRDVVSATSFSLVGSFGHAYYGVASNAYGVRPAFSIYSPAA